MARFLTSANSEFALDAICGRLSEAGIPVLKQGSLQDHGVEFVTFRDIYVEDHDLERAKEVLRANESFDEDELARLSEEAYREATEAEEGTAE